MSKASNSHCDPKICHISGADETIWYQNTCDLDLIKPIFTRAYWQDRNAITGSAAGRGRTLFIEDKGSSYVLRPFLRGGLPGKALTDQFLFTGYQRTRAWREFRLLLDMRSLQLPVPEPVVANAKRSGLIYRSSIIIKRIPDARDLQQLLCEQALPMQIWQNIGATVKRFHKHQVYHHDLNSRNIMLDKQQRTWLIDFDRCGINSGQHWKRQNLQRLHRSLSKELRQNVVFHWTKNDWQAFLDGYNHS